MSEQQQAGPMSPIGFGRRVGLAGLVLVVLALITPPLAIEETEWAVPRYAIVAALWLIASAVLTNRDFGDALFITLVGAIIYVVACIAAIGVLSMTFGPGAASDWANVTGVAIGATVNVGWLYTARNGKLWSDEDEYDAIY